MQSPALVRRRGKAPGEEILLRFAQAVNAPDLCEHSDDSFFHDATLPADGWGVEGENFPSTEPIRDAAPNITH